MSESSKKYFKELLKDAKDKEDTLSELLYAVNGKREVISDLVKTVFEAVPELFYKKDYKGSRFLGIYFGMADCKEQNNEIILEARKFERAIDDFLSFWLPIRHILDPKVGTVVNSGSHFCHSFNSKELLKFLKLVYFCHFELRTIFEDKNFFVANLERGYDLFSIKSYNSFEPINSISIIKTLNLEGAFCSGYSFIGLPLLRDTCGDVLAWWDINEYEIRYFVKEIQEKEISCKNTFEVAKSIYQFLHLWAPIHAYLDFQIYKKMFLRDGALLDFLVFAYQTYFDSPPSNSIYDELRTYIFKDINNIYRQTSISQKECTAFCCIENCAPLSEIDPIVITRKLLRIYDERLLGDWVFKIFENFSKWWKKNRDDMYYLGGCFNFLENIHNFLLLWAPRHSVLDFQICKKAFLRREPLLNFLVLAYQTYFCNSLSEEDYNKIKESVYKRVNSESVGDSSKETVFSCIKNYDSLSEIDPDAINSKINELLITYDSEQSRWPFYWASEICGTFSQWVEDNRNVMDSSFEIDA